ncbi:SurA N-terminal domain-containing protein [Acidocella facilis]|uniref:SurA N-terminal domain-containing protein n=1 Tax=Acidocella facilis TaxID=525 RepID=UPI0009DCCA36|nr:SurA N-terminal domain-containing protein [Acidocella facilis]
MLVWVRNLMGSWVARVFFALLVVVFIFWGVSNVFTMAGSPNAVATVAGQPVDVSVVQAAYQRALNQYQQQGQTPDQATRQQLAEQALSAAIREKIMRQAAAYDRIGVPDAAVRAVLDGIPAFQTNGSFDKAKFAQVLRQNGLSENEFINEIKDEVISRQLITPIINGAQVPDEMLGQIFGLLGEQRTASLVNVPVNTQPVPATPSDAVLQRFWQNHQSQFTSPEYRKIQLVILSPALMAPHEKVSEAEVQAAVARAQANSPSTPVRSADVLSVEDLADASQLLAAWKKGASWAKMQALAKSYHAVSVPLAKMQQNQIPSGALANAIFAAPAGQVMGPIAGGQGMYLFKVTDIGQSGPDQAQLVAQATQQLQLQQAQADVAKNVDALQDALAGQTPLDQLPGNLGLVAVEGTLDAGGQTPDGSAAPIPGGDDLRNAIVKAAFATQPGQAAKLQSGPDGSYYALTVQKLLPPAVQAFAQAKAKVLAAWQQDQQIREAEVIAADLMHNVNTGTPIAKAASAQGLTATASPVYTRQTQPQDQPSTLVPSLFAMKSGQATMIQTKDGFLVAALTKVVQPTPQSDPAMYAQLQQSLNKGLQDDLGGSFLAGLQARDKVTVNQKLFAQIYQ